VYTDSEKKKSYLDAIASSNKEISAGSGEYALTVDYVTEEVTDEMRFVYRFIVRAIALIYETLKGESKITKQGLINIDHEGQSEDELLKSIKKWFG
jgi:hypothetical protein